MSPQLNNNHTFRLGTLTGMVSLIGLVGCGEGMPDPTESAQAALTGNNTSMFGPTTGTNDTHAGNHQTPVTKIFGYGSSAYVYGIKLFWGTSSQMFGNTNGTSAQEWNISGDPVYKVEYSTSGGMVIGLRFTNSTSNLTLGNIASPGVAFNDEEAILTDMETWKGNQDGTIITWATKFYYTTP